MATDPAGGAHGAPAPAVRALDVIAPGSTTGLGGLPHLSASQAVDFTMAAFDIPAVPYLPRRSPAESPIARALVGVHGVTLGHYGTLAVDTEALDPDVPVAADLSGDHFTGLRRFLAEIESTSHARAVTWEFAGPLSVGLALIRAGATPDLAFAVAYRSVCTHLSTISAAIAAAAPGAGQLALISEPLASEAGSNDFPLSPDEAVDLVSGAMAVVTPSASVGVCSEGDVDLSLLMEAGPEVIAIRASPAVAALAGRLDRFLANGGWVAWGAVATGGPIGVTVTRSWLQLIETWQELAGRGCSMDALGAQCLLTPDGGLVHHNPIVAERICRSVRDVAGKLRAAMPTITTST